MAYLHKAAITQLATQRLNGDEQTLIAPFLETYYSLVSDSDLSEHTPDYLFDMAYRHFQAVLSYDGDSNIVKAYNPEDSDQSVIDIVTPDNRFLIDSVQMAFMRAELAIHFITHPIYQLSIDQGRVQSLANATYSGDDNTSVIHIAFDRVPDAQLPKLVENITEVLNKLRSAVGDWQAMDAQLQTVIAEAKQAKLPKENTPETAQATVIKFLQWLSDGHFVFLGYRSCDFRESHLYIQGSAGLGILRETGGERQSRSFEKLPPSLKDQALLPNLLTISKSPKLSPIHRSAYMDFIRVKRFDDSGNVIGEHQFQGLLTAKAYRALPSDIPLVADKIAAITSNTELPVNSHAAKLFNNVISQLPRDELFQSTTEQIKDMALPIFHLQKRDALRFFARVDLFETFVMCYVYVPKDRYSTKLRMQFESYLVEAMGGYASEFSTHFSDSLHVRVNIIVSMKSGMVKPFNRQQIEDDLTPMMCDWHDETARLLREQLGDANGNQLFSAFEKSIPATYQDDFTPSKGVDDLSVLHNVLCGGASPQLALSQCKTKTVTATEATTEGAAASTTLQLKLYGTGALIALSDVLPVLENFGFTVKSATPYVFERVTCNNGADDSDTPIDLWLIDFRLTLPAALNQPLADIAETFTDAFTRTWHGVDTSDKFDQLVLSQGLSARDTNILRAISKYMVQAKAPFSHHYMQQVINLHPTIAKALLALFYARLGLDVAARDSVVSELTANIEAQLDQVASLDEDRILRWFMTVINAVVRTNFFQVDKNGDAKPYLSMKIHSASIANLPLPKPLYEIFVYSNDMEAIHLRGGKVARGGLRWSDRIEDFRTEVLGLVKAQIVKNAVIVPVGSKGGFIVKNPDHSSRDAFLKQGIECYKTFMRGLLDITDNIVAGDITPPANVYCHDEYDPYLVVAADKGTATFSDIANAMAEEYGFWLGDAFASGGSVGYDHKGMGITARGAWESVKRHFRHLGKNIQKETFTVVGIGDMGGDVFGNGMLLSEHIQLTAAFNHLHIFIDPTPDAASTFAERQRLFDTPKATWADFNAKLISKGGGIFSRSDKAIAITPEMQKTFAISETSLSPNQLIQALLKAPVELLWNGGIGTYVKAENETHDQVGDKANDALRINGSELRCQVIGEGGNLGFTQLGRIEFAKCGGSVLTDAIDNAAGVNCSDHEVNIKILLNQLVEAGTMTVPERNALLESMTDDVAKLVLRQNYQQPQAISMGASDTSLFVDHVRIIRQLEKTGRLNRELEYLPSDAEIKQRFEAGKGLYAPELAVMLAYSKIQLFEDIVASDLPDMPIFQAELTKYFPQALSEKAAAAEAMQTHRLRREIIGTFVVNSILNHMGTVFVHRTKEVTGQSSEQIVLAYCAARDILNAREYWHKIDALDNIIDADLQNALHLRVRKTLEQFSHWFLTHQRDEIDVSKLQSDFKNVATIAEKLPQVLAEKTIKRCTKEAQSLIEQGVPETLAKQLVYLPHLDCALDIVALANHRQLALEDATNLYFAVANTLDARWLASSINALYDKDYWQRRACHSLMNNLKNTLFSVSESAAKLDSNCQQAHMLWKEAFAERLASYQHCLTEIRQGQIDLSRLSVAIGEMTALSLK